MLDIGRFTNRPYTLVSLFSYRRLSPDFYFTEQHRIAIGLAMLADRGKGHNSARSVLVHTCEHLVPAGLEVGRYREGYRVCDDPAGVPYVSRFDCARRPANRRIYDVEEGRVRSGDEAVRAIEAVNIMPLREL